MSVFGRSKLVQAKVSRILTTTPMHKIFNERFFLRSQTPVLSCVIPRKEKKEYGLMDLEWSVKRSQTFYHEMENSDGICESFLELFSEMCSSQVS